LLERYNNTIQLFEKEEIGNFSLSNNRNEKYGTPLFSKLNPHGQMVLMVTHFALQCATLLICGKK
jgi:hypothetical protein